MSFSTHFPPVSPDQNEVLAGMQKKLKRVPEIYARMANAPSVLEGYMALNKSLYGQGINAKTAEAIALRVGELNGCAYCLAAHTAVAKAQLRMDDSEILDLRQGRSKDPQIQAVLDFAEEVVLTRGHPNEKTRQALLDQDFSPPKILILTGHIVKNILTNYFNHVMEPEIDYPEAPKL